MFKSLMNSFSNMLDIDYNKSSFTGCMDVIVFKKADGTYECTNFYIKFGKFKVFKYKEKKVEILINGVLTNHHMKINKQGNCYFEIDVEEENFDSDDLSILISE